MKNLFKYVNPSKVISPRDYVKKVKVLFDGGEKSYSIAELEWEGVLTYGIRWNISRREYEDKNKKLGKKKCIGMPNSRGFPVWFILPQDIHPLIIQIINNK